MCCDAQGNKILPDWVTFRAQFPQYADPAKYPDTVLQMYWDEVTCFVSDENYGYLIGNCRLFLINLFVAHMMQLTMSQQRGKQGGFITSSTIDKVSVQKQAPPSPNQFSWWLNQTPYGAQALALLEASVVGGDLFGGSGELGGFRRSGGRFTPWANW